ncbi:zinc-ribbon domain-containing protein, partial [Myxococcota bacterium]|nr:zinc-ribbon domain-containing protein [Myxococcota bacterium]
MKIICPKCGADYNINDSKIPPDGLHIKCPKCLHSFVATKEGAAALGSSGVSTSSMRAVSVPQPTPAPASPIVQTVQGMPVRPVAMPVPPPPPPRPPQGAAPAGGPLPPPPPVPVPPPPPPPPPPPIVETFHVQFA